MSRRKKKKPPELKVVFDTNVLYSKLASDLIKPAAVKLIKENSDYPDLAISWYLPETVRHERQYQMEREALRFIPSIEKLQRLLGHNLNITDDILKDRVKQTVERAITAHKFNVLQIESDKVDWRKVMLDSVYRHPPFDPGESEKGFRDAQIVEAFMQLVGISPATPSRCLIALVTDDKLLEEAVALRATSKPNVRIVSSIPELEGLINTLVSNVGEEFVSQIQDKAESYFFEKGKSSTLYYKEGVQPIIMAKFGDELASVPGSDMERENGTWYVGSPKFLRKERARMHWVTTITVEAKLFEYVEITLAGAGTPPTPASGLGITLTPSGTVSGPFPGLGISGHTEPTSLLFGGPTGLLPSPRSRKKELVGNGESKFEVEWRVSINQQQRLASGKVDDIKHVETIWT